MIAPRDQERPVPDREDVFGGWSIAEGLFDRLLALTPPHGLVVELGSGFASPLVAQERLLISIEDHPDFVALYKAALDEGLIPDAIWPGGVTAPRWCMVHAPIVNGWYALQPIRDALHGADIATLLVDGPPAETVPGGRSAFLQNLGVFPPPNVILVDDLQRTEDRRAFDLLGQHLLSYTETDTEKDGEKAWGWYALPEEVADGGG